jgi:ubiquinone/menaquinone biosynthesis C-methylase UbiE
VGTSPLDFIPRIMNEIQGRRILDVGCGAGVYGYLLRNKWQDTPPGSIQFRDFGNRDVSNDQPEWLVGIDIHTENVRRCHKHAIYDFIALARAEQLPFPENYVDTILCVEVLEHLFKDDAVRALKQFERIARQRIVVTVPKISVDRITGQDQRAFLRVETSDPDVRQWVQAETHKCSFSASELARLGFRIGRNVGQGWRAPFRLALKFWENHGPRSGQILAVKELNKQNNLPSTSRPPEPPKWTHGFPDYR